MNSIDVSLPRSVTVRGQVIRRMPLGRYLQAIRMLEGFPREVAMRLVPDGTIAAALEALKTLDREKLLDLLLKALTVVPEQMVGLIAALTEIPEDTLWNDPQIGADGLLEIVDAFLEVNAAENFIRAAGRLRQHIGRLAATLKPGSSG
ncbi:MAG TPA: hypothetical protein PKU80_02905 [Candidatus Limiplasma sp.]|nr:hypothetical protein [Candidatus Limiplasma sp.]HRX07697.1 hypothetical protein [Candidatus Limiplasma sp.]